MPIKSVSIIGLGAEGSIAYYALRKSMPREAVSVIADGERAERLKNSGININGVQYELHVRAAGDCEEKPQLIIVAVKDHQLAGTYEAIAKELGQDTAIVSLMNGISSEEQLSQQFGTEHVVYSVSRINAKKSGNKVEFIPFGEILIGEKDRHVSQRVKDIYDLFSAGVDTVISDDICLDIWRKFLFNSACNTVEAIFHGNHSWFQRIPEACDAMECIMQEIVKLAHAMDIGLTQEDIRHLDGIFNKYASDGMCSMAQDMVSGRPTEINMFMGEALRLGKLHGVDLPVCRFVYDIIVSMDKVNQGALASESD